MVSQSAKTLQDLVKHVGRYPEEAFLFVREGLSYAADQVHGPETEAHRALAHYLAETDLDWNDLITRYHAGELPERMEQVIEAAGGCERLNRHVSGRELCWALRDYALHQWGLMARVVLESWRVRSSADFGRIVFGFIDFDMMRKQDEDRIEDFKDVYAFTEAFEAPFRANLRNGHGDARRTAEN
jgi:uncharacterized repeat protein (TIGR04138 family)